MSTRSLIAIELPDGKVKSIYVHSDGYVEGNGKLLVEHYSTYDKAIKLFDYGDCSYLGETTNECSFYKRDWDRDNHADTVTYNNEFCLMYENSGATMIEYIYIYKDGEWHVSESNYIPKSMLGNNAYDISLVYWSNFEKVIDHKDFKKDAPSMSEVDMLGQIGKALKQSLGDSGSMIMQGARSKDKTN